MELPLQAELVPPHIDGFIMQGDLRLSRFAAGRGGQLSTEAPQHHRRELELQVALCGRALCLLGDQRVQLTAHDMLWVLPRQNRLMIDVSEDFRAWVLVFRPRLVRRVLTTDASADLRRSGGGQVPVRRLTTAQVEVLEQLYASVPLGKGRDVFNAGLGYALTRSWLAYREAEQAGRGDASSAVHPAVRKAAWLLRESAEPLDNLTLGARCGLSPQRLSRLFKQQMGTNLSEFRNRQRMERLLRQLSQPHPPSLLQAVFDAGFGSYPQFHRLFRRYVGLSPAEYMRAKTPRG